MNHCTSDLKGIDQLLKRGKNKIRIKDFLFIAACRYKFKREKSQSNVQTFHIFMEKEMMHCFLLEESPSSAAASSVGAALKKKNMQHWNNSLKILHLFLMHGEITKRILLPLTYTRQLGIVQIHSSQPVLTNKERCHECWWPLEGSGEGSFSSPWSGRTCEKRSLWSGRTSWGQWRTHNMRLGTLLWWGQRAVSRNWQNNPGIITRAATLTIFSVVTPEVSQDPFHLYLCGLLMRAIQFLQLSKKNRRD